MANPDRDTAYTNDGSSRSVYTRESNSTGWFVGIIVALALLAIAYLVFSANSQPSTTSLGTAPAVTDTVPAAPVDTTTTPMAPADTATPVVPAAPATDLSLAPAPAESSAPATAQ
jgi:hypothetical protein